jgi:hypothetical protein
MWGITFTRWSYSAVNTHSGSLRLSGSCGTTRHTHHDPDRCQQSAGARGGEGGGLTLLAMTTQLATMSTSTVLSNHGLHTHGVGGSRGGYSWPALNPRAQLPGRHAHTRAAPCQPQAPYSAVAATARDPPSPSRAPLNQSDEEGPYWVVDSHEAPRQPAVDSSRGRNLLRRRIFSCGQHRIPDHLGKREPPLAGTYHRLPVRRTAFGRHLRVCGYTKERKQLSKISPLRSGGGRGRGRAGIHLSPSGKTSGKWPFKANYISSTDSHTRGRRERTYFVESNKTQLTPILILNLLPCHTPLIGSEEEKEGRRGRVKVSEPLNAPATAQTFGAAGARRSPPLPTTTTLPTLRARGS